jgi:hypothetical protein
MELQKARHDALESPLESTKALRKESLWRRRFLTESAAGIAQQCAKAPPDAVIHGRHRHHAMASFRS